MEQSREMESRKNNLVEWNQTFSHSTKLEQERDQKITEPAKKATERTTSIKPYRTNTDE